MFVTMYSNREHGEKAVFIRMNNSHNGAWDSALEDAKTALPEYDNQNGTQEIDCIEGENDDPSIIRIINPNNGYEYEAYIIEEHIVND